MLAADMPHDCQKCPLGMGRANIVVYRGTQAAPIMFVGEAPGAEEDKTGKPFMGRSGKLLDKWIEKLGLKDGDYSITNICRCRPPNNRTPTKAERQACGPHLLRFIESNSPAIIIALGRTADTFLDEVEIPHLFLKHPAWFLRGHKWEEDLNKLKDEITKEWEYLGT